jgi:hypothetical protein
MRRFALPNLTLALALLASGVIVSASAQADSGLTRMRVDCRFYSNSSRFCYSSAIYGVTDRGDIQGMRFGAGCDYETIYDDGGTTSPQDELSDTIRPPTAAIPRVEITPKGSLRHAGTYTAKLEIDRGRLTDGTCYVRELEDGEEQSQAFFQNWFYFQ